MRGIRGIGFRSTITGRSILVLSAVDSMLSESLVQSPLERQMAVGDTERVPRRRPGTRFTLRAAHSIPCRNICTTAGALYDARHGSRGWPLEVIIFLRCQPSNTLEHYAADTLAPQPVCYVRRGNLSLPELEDGLSRGHPWFPLALTARDTSDRPAPRKFSKKLLFFLTDSFVRIIRIAC